MARHEWGVAARAVSAARLAATLLLSLAAGCAARSAPEISVSDPVGSDRWVIPVAVREAARAGRSPAASDPPGGCFSRQIGSERWAVRAAEAAVQVLITDENGWRANSSGFVVRASGAPGEPGNRIVTAWHSVNKALAGGQGLIAIRNSAGAPIGRAEVVARGATGFTAALGRSVPRGDIAVLAMRDFVTGGEAAFAAIEGVDIAPVQAGSAMTGMFERPGGIEPGASGSGILDVDGRVVGVMIARDRPEEGSAERLWSAMVTVEGGEPSRWLAPGIAATPTRSVKLLARAIGFALPLTDPDILGALGGAARGVTSRSSWSDRTVIENVTVPAYPLGTCIVYRGNIGPGGSAIAASR